jgi:hypothetical protein
VRDDERARRMDERERAADERERIADERDAAADRRDRTADLRDAMADERDRRSAKRDADVERILNRALARDVAADHRDAAARARDAAAELRYLAAGSVSVEDAADDRARAQVDRGWAGRDRDLGAGDRADFVDLVEARKWGDADGDGRSQKRADPALDRSMSQTESAREPSAADGSAHVEQESDRRF